MTILRRLVSAEEGQDLVEYGLLAVLVVLASIVTWQAIAAAIGFAYAGYDTGVQGLWEPPPPGITP
jgi:Flp pilus assembly pilin Flp